MDLTSELLAKGLIIKDRERWFTIEEDLAGPRARLTLVDCFPARTEWVRSTLGVSVDQPQARDDGVH